MSAPFISVIVPVYNVSSYLPECLDSILAQTHNNFELVAVNDGSTDSSLDILVKYSMLDHRIRIVSQRNMGLAAARNTGLAHAKGEYVAFVDSDDYIDEDYLSSMLSRALEYDADISICGRNKVVNGVEVHEIRPFCNERAMDASMSLRALNSYRSFDMSMCGKLFNSQLFEGISFPDGKNSEDQFVCYRLILKASVIYYEDRPLYCYRHRVGSISRGSKVNTFPIEASREQLEAFRKSVPELVYAGETSCFFSQVAVFNAFSIRGRDLPGEISGMLEKESPKYLVSVLKNPDLTLKKKAQALIFVFCRPLYKRFYVLRRS